MIVCPCLCRHGLRGVTKTECVGGARLCWRSIGRLASRRTSLSCQRGGDAIRKVNAVPTDYQSRRRDGQDSIHFPHRADLPQALLHQRVFPRAIRARQMPNRCFARVTIYSQNNDLNLMRWFTNCGSQFYFAICR